MAIKKRLIKVSAAALLFLLVKLGAAFAEDSKSDCVSAAGKLKQGLVLKDGSLSELNFYRDAIQQCPSMAEAHHNVGIVYLKQGNKDEATNELEKAVELKGDASSRLALASILFDDGKNDRAEEQYQRVLEKDESNVKALQGLGVVRDKKGDTAGAVTVLEKAKGLDDSNAVTLFNLGLLYTKMKRSEDAVTVLSRTLELDPKQDQALVLLVSELLTLDRVDEAVTRIERGIKESTSADVFRIAGQVYQKVGDHEKAEVYYRKALTLNPKDATARTNLAVVLITKKQEGLAETELSKVTVDEPTNSRAFSVLGWSQIELGKYREAEINLRRSIELDPGNADAKNNLGVLFQRQGRSQSAADAYKEALKVNPSLESAKNNLDKIQ